MRDSRARDGLRALGYGYGHDALTFLRYPDLGVPQSDSVEEKRRAISAQRSQLGLEPEEQGEGVILTDDLIENFTRSHEIYVEFSSDTD